MKDVGELPSMEEFEKLLAESFQSDLPAEPLQQELPAEATEPLEMEQAAVSHDDDTTAEIVLADVSPDKTNPAA